jgi:hypothetical protein
VSVESRHPETHSAQIHLRLAKCPGRHLSWPIQYVSCPWKRLRQQPFVILRGGGAGISVAKKGLILKSHEKKIVPERIEENKVLMS